MSAGVYMMGVFYLASAIYLVHGNHGLSRLNSVLAVVMGASAVVGVLYS